MLHERSLLTTIERSSPNLLALITNRGVRIKACLALSGFGSAKLSFGLLQSRIVLERDLFELLECQRRARSLRRLLIRVAHRHARHWCRPPLLRLLPDRTGRWCNRRAGWLVLVSLR